MARVALTPQDIVITGLNATYSSADATNDHSVANGRGDVMIHVVNGGGGAINVTVPTPATAAQGLTIQDPTISVPAGQDRFIGPFDLGVFNQSDGTGVYIDLDSDTSVTIAALRLPRL